MYNLVLVAEAMSDRDAEAQGSSVERTFPGLGGTTTASDVVKMLAQP